MVVVVVLPLIFHVRGLYIGHHILKFPFQKIVVFLSTPKWASERTNSSFTRSRDPSQDTQFSHYTSTCIGSMQTISSVRTSVASFPVSCLVLLPRTMLSFTCSTLSDGQVSVICVGHVARLFCTASRSLLQKKLKYALPLILETFTAQFRLPLHTRWLGSDKSKVGSFSGLA